MMFVKVYKSYRDVVSICDSNLLGKIFEEGELRIEAKENFYKDEELSFEEVVRLMVYMRKEDATFNLVGEESVKAALEAGIISEDGVKTVQGIPVALVLL